VSNGAFMAPAWRHFVEQLNLPDVVKEVSGHRTAVRSNDRFCEGFRMPAADRRCGELRAAGRGPRHVPLAALD
jgi:hypothetical protein